MMIDAIDETSLMLSNFPAQETHKRFIVIWSKTFCVRLSEPAPKEL